MICFKPSAFVFTLLKNRDASLYSQNFFPSLIKPSYVINKFFHRQVNERVEEILRAEDNVPNSYKIIYRAPLKTYFKISYYTTFSGLALLVPVIGSSLYMSELGNFPIILYNTQVVHSAGELYGLIGAFLLVSTQIGLVVFKYPFRIYKDSEKKHYIAVYQHFLPWKHTNEEFLAGELKKSTSKMPWRDSMYAFRKKKAILMEDYFSKPAELNEMLQPNSSSKNHNT
uniref:Putative conserved plasma membrane protein n=1 Tax=Panstrongylus lignarius TaxID=156445 RepID=A0A224XVY7_9HEMI